MKYIFWFFKSLIQIKKGYCPVSFEGEDFYLTGFMSAEKWKEFKKENDF